MFGNGVQLGEGVDLGEALEPGEDGALFEGALREVERDLGGGESGQGLGGGHVDGEHYVVAGVAELFAVTNDV